MSLILDVFNGDAFSAATLTNVISKIPYVPNRIGRLNLFEEVPIATLSAAIDEIQESLGLVPVSARGSRGSANTKVQKKIRSFQVPHLCVYDEVLASDIQNFRDDSGNVVLDAVQKVVESKMKRMKQNLEATIEYHRVGAITGVTLDADGSTVIYDWFDEFGLTQTSFPWDFDEDDAKANCSDVIQLIETALGGTPFTEVYAICGANFFKNFIAMETVERAYDKQTDGAFFRTQQAQIMGNEAPFEFGNIKWVQYRGSVGGVNFVPTNECRFFPVGAPGLFLRWNAPADYVEAANTLGQPIYAKQEVQRFGKGIDIEAQSNPLLMCSRPKCLIKGTTE